MFTNILLFVILELTPLYTYLFITLLCYQCLGPTVFPNIISIFRSIFEILLFIIEIDNFEIITYKNTLFTTFLELNNRVKERIGHGSALDLLICLQTTKAHSAAVLYKFRKHSLTIFAKLDFNEIIILWLKNTHCKQDHFALIKRTAHIRFQN